MRDCVVYCAPVIKIWQFNVKLPSSLLLADTAADVFKNSSRHSFSVSLEDRHCCLNWHAYVKRSTQFKHISVGKESFLVTWIKNKLLTIFNTSSEIKEFLGCQQKITNSPQIKQYYSNINVRKNYRVAIATICSGNFSYLHAATVGVLVPELFIIFVPIK